MCGGIIGALSFGLPPSVRQSSSSYMLYLVIYSLGRILSYAAAGALVGWLGEGLLELMGAAGGRRWLQWGVAVVMVVIGLHIAGWLPRLIMIERLGGPLWRYLEPIGQAFDAHSIHASGLCLWGNMGLVAMWPGVHHVDFGYC